MFNTCLHFLLWVSALDCHVAITLPELQSVSLVKAERHARTSSFQVLNIQEDVKL